MENLNESFITHYSCNYKNTTANDSKNSINDCQNIMNGTHLVIMPEPPVYIYTAVSIMYIIIFILGICGNILVLIVIIKCKTLHNPTNWLLMNLSIADLCVILVCMPTSFVELFTKDVWYLGQFLCKYDCYLNFMYLRWLTLYSS